MNEHTGRGQFGIRDMLVFIGVLGVVLAIVASLARLDPKTVIDIVDHEFEAFLALLFAFSLVGFVCLGLVVFQFLVCQPRPIIPVVAVVIIMASVIGWVVASCSGVHGGSAVLVLSWPGFYLALACVCASAFEAIIRRAHHYWISVVCLVPIIAAYWVGTAMAASMVAQYRGH